MKRYGYLIEKIVEESNLLEAFSMVMRGKKRTRTVRLFKKTGIKFWPILQTKSSQASTRRRVSGNLKWWKTVRFVKSSPCHLKTVLPFTR